MLRKRRRLGQFVLRSTNQVALSVLATLAATAIYSGLRHATVEVAPPAAPPAVTSGGKLAARIAGAEIPAAEPALHLPILSLATWDAPRVAPPAFDPVHADAMAPLAAHPPRPAAPRRIEVATATPARPIALPHLDAPPAVVAEAQHPLWAGATTAAMSTASSAVSTATAAVGSATTMATSAVRGVVAMGGTLVAHVLP